MNRPTRSFLLLAVAMIIAVPAGAQVETNSDKGFYLGLRFVSSGLRVEDDGQSGFSVKDGGGGLNLVTGYSFNPGFSLQLELGMVRHETSSEAIDAAFTSLALFAHYRFVPGRTFRPYIKGGLAGYGLLLTDYNIDVRITGGGVPLGGGFDFYLSSHFAVGLDFTYNIVSYDKVTVDLGSATAGFDIDEDGSQSSLGLSVTFYF